MLDNTRGALLTIVSKPAFAVNDVAIKATSGVITFSNCCFCAASFRACSS